MFFLWLFLVLLVSGLFILREVLNYLAKKELLLANQCYQILNERLKKELETCTCKNKAEENQAEK